MTCRGITNIRLVDFDRVTLSSLNRHATATLADVQKTKVDCIASALKRMSLKVEVDARNQLWSLANGANLLEGMDWVIGKLVLSYRSFGLFLIAGYRRHRQYHHQNRFAQVLPQRGHQGGCPPTCLLFRFY